MKTKTTVLAATTLFLTLRAAPASAQTTQEFSQWYSPSENLCYKSGNIQATSNLQDDQGAENFLFDPINAVACDRSDISQFFVFAGYDGPNTQFHIVTYNGYGVLNSITNTWFDFWTQQNEYVDTIITSPYCPSCYDTWTQDTNGPYGELHLVTGQVAGRCAAGPGWMTGVPCDGGNSDLHFQIGDIYAPGAANPHPYVRGTLQPYSPAEPGFVMDVLYNSRANGTKVDLARYNGTSAQFWNVVYQPSSGWYEIQLAGSNPRMCLDKPNGENGDGTQLQIWQCNGEPQQLWRFPGSSNIMNAQSGKCLEPPFGEFGTSTWIQVYDCDEKINQNWFGTPVFGP